MDLDTKTEWTVSRQTHSLIEDLPANLTRRHHLAPPKWWSSPSSSSTKPVSTPSFLLKKTTNLTFTHRRPHLQSHVRSGPPEARLKRLPHSSRNLPRHPRHITQYKSRPSSSTSPRQQETTHDWDRESGEQSLQADVLSNADWGEVLAVHESGATQHGAGDSEVLRDLRGLCDEESLLQYGNAHSSGKV